MQVKEYFPNELQRQTADEIDREILGRLRRAASRHPERFVPANYRELACGIHLCESGDKEREDFIRERVAQFIKIGLLRRARWGDVAGWVVPKLHCTVDGFTTEDVQLLREMLIAL